MPNLAEIPHYQSLLAESSTDGPPPSLDQFDHLRAYRELGPIYKVRFRDEDWVVIGGLDANDLAWRHPDAWSYHDALEAFREVMGPTHVTQLDGKAHRAKRKTLKPGFAMSQMGKVIPAIDATVAEQFRTHTGELLDLHAFFMETLTEANCRSVVDFPLTKEQRADFIRFEETFIGNTQKAPAVRRAFYNDPEFAALRERVIGVCETIVKRRAGGERKDDNFQAVLDTHETPLAELPIHELVSECYLILMAGTGNTAKVLNCGLRHLLDESAWLVRLQEEVDRYSPMMLAGGMTEFPLLKATLMEMERLFPAAPVMPRKSAIPLEFAGVEIPAGTKILHLHTLPHFLEEIYEEPYRFKPQRWIDNEYPRKAHGTFGGSTHVCLGMNLARVHMPILLCNLLRDYTLQVEELPDIKVNFNYGVPQTSNLRARLVGKG
jgi:hypothetical protein